MRPGTDPRAAHLLDQVHGQLLRQSEADRPSTAEVLAALARDAVDQDLSTAIVATSRLGDELRENPPRCGGRWLKRQQSEAYCRLVTRQLAAPRGRP